MRVLNHYRHTTVATAGALVLAAALAGCGGDEPAASGGSGAGSGAGSEAASDTLASAVDLSGVTMTVGSKEFTEQRILGQILVKSLQAAGADVTDQTGLSGTPVVRAALESGEIDAYYEYTGTGWISILQETTPVAGSEEQFDAVKEADAENGITWFAPAPANNTYAIAVNEQLQEEYSPVTISDYAGIVQDNPDDAGLCSAAEFITRDDGLPGLGEAYGFELAKDKVATLDFGLVYASVAKGDPCNAAVVFATDGQIQANSLTVLEDDKGFFPAYNIALTMKTELYDAHQAEFDEFFGELNELLTTEQMQELNAAVDVEGQEVEAVVDGFLEENNVV